MLIGLDIQLFCLFCRSTERRRNKLHVQNFNQETTKEEITWETEV